jgi:hypothetical protein
MARDREVLRVSQGMGHGASDGAARVPPCPDGNSLAKTSVRRIAAPVQGSYAPRLVS